jgi:hypothetical protein
VDGRAQILRCGWFATFGAVGDGAPEVEAP